MNELLEIQPIIIVTHSEYQLLKSITAQTIDTEFEWLKKWKWVFQNKIILISNVVNIGAIPVGSIIDVFKVQIMNFWTHSLNSHACLTYIWQAQEEGATQQKRLFQRRCKRSINGCCHFSFIPQILNRYVLYVKHCGWLWDEAMMLHYFGTQWG